MAEEKRYLDYDGLAYLVERLTNKIEASGGGSGGGLSPGVYLAYTDSDGYPRLLTGDGSPGDYIDGAVVVEGGRRLLVAKEDSKSSCLWTSNMKDTGGCVTSDAVCAAHDFGGNRNTLAAYDTYLSNTSTYSMEAAVSAYGYDAARVPARLWWLPSLGELTMVFRHIAEINELFARYGINSLAARYEDGEGYWSSTVADNYSAWMMRYDGAQWWPVSQETAMYGCARPVTEWVWFEG